MTLLVHKMCFHSVWHTISAQQTLVIMTVYLTLWLGCRQVKRLMNWHTNREDGVTFYNKYREALSLTNCDLGQIITLLKLYFLTRIIGIMMPPPCKLWNKNSTVPGTSKEIHKYELSSLCPYNLSDNYIGWSGLQIYTQHSCCHSAVLSRQLFYILLKLACFKI